MYQKEVTDILKKLNSSSNGLSTMEANERLMKNGKNILPKEKKKNIFQIFISEFIDPIIFVMIAAIFFSFLIGEVVDALAIIFIILVDAIMGTIQEYKAGKSAESLENIIKTKTSVLRDGKKIKIIADDLVVGDIVLLESGDKVSADLRIIEANNLTIDESILTGESMASVKNEKTINSKVSLAEQKNMAFAGTSVITGRAKCIVVACSVNTEIGKIASKVIETKQTKSPLMIRMEKFSKQISLLVVIVAILLTFLLLMKKELPAEIFLSVVALSVSAMPEGLPLALTLALTIGSNRMSKRNVIVKKLNSVESLGSCTVIASDKTGTLTINEQTAKKIVLPDSSFYEVEGIGYNDNGKIIGDNLKKANEISFLGAINNEAELVFEKNNWTYIGDSIDVAFLALAKKQKIQIDNKILGEIPYESEKKYSSVFYEKDGKNYCTVKGSLEKVFAFCDRMQMGDEIKKIDKDLITKQNEKLASEGYRVIALAKGEVLNFEEHKNYEEKDIPNLIFMGLVAFIDPIRKETISAIENCNKAGIKVVMVTGDHPLTAFAIAKELKLASSYDQVATGDEIDEYLEKGKNEFDQFIKTKTIFTRVTPIQKLQIIESYKRQGEFVAVTGDGVNDAPAIKAANIGIAMGSGTEVAKETGTMIITDDNFLSIVAGIEEGRNAYSNIRKVIYMLLSCGIAEVLFFVLAILFNMPMPLVAVQLLWLNIVTDGLQDLALSFEREEKEIMNDKPRDPKETVFDKLLLSEVLLSGLFIGISVFILWLYLIKGLHFDVKVARGYVMAYMVFIQNFHVLNCRSEKRSTFKISLFRNPFIIFSILSAIVLQIIVMEVPIFSLFLGTSSIPFKHMIYIIIASLPILVLMETFKYFIRKNKM